MYSRRSVADRPRGFVYNSRIIVRLISFVLPHVRLVSFNAISLVGMLAFMFIMPWFMAQAVDSINGQETSIPLIDGWAVPGTVYYLFLIALCLLAAGVLRGAFAFAQTFLNQSISQRVAYDVRNHMYEAYQKQL